MPDLVFVHLSDVHFREGRVGDAHDPDLDLRNELEFSLRRVRSRLPRLDGLIVSGDIAFGGKRGEYFYARSWLVTICELLGFGPESVMLTPGNHDVDRDLVPLEGEGDSLREEIRLLATVESRDARLAAVLRDPTLGERLFGPLTEYNAFAEDYGCAVTAAQPFWERNFPLNDGTQLRIRGISTTLISGPRDDHRTHKLMVYGAAQRTLGRVPNVRQVVVGHHPPSWSLEGDVADQAFSARAVLQLFGHKHDQWIAQIGNSVRLIAGALHPDRAEQQWLPRYNIIAITASDERRLALRVYPHRWSSEELKFIPDYNSEGKDYRDFTLVVDRREGDVPAQSSRPAETLGQLSTVDESTLAFRLGRVSPDIQSAIAVELELCEPGSQVPGTIEIVRIASALGRAGELRLMVDRHLRLMT